MRISRVEASNFLCFKELSLECDKALQLIAGPNNSGKSSLIRLLEAFFSTAGSPELQRLQPANDYFAQAGPRTLSVIKIWFDDLTNQDRQLAGDAVRRDGKFWVSVRCSRAGTVTYDASRVGTGEVARDLYAAVVARHHFVKIPSVRVGGASDVENPAPLERLIDTLESILIRRGGSRSTQVQTDFLGKTAAVEEAVKSVLDESAQRIHAELPFRDGTVQFTLRDFRHALRGMLQATVIESTEGARVPVQDRGTGFQSALVLGILRYVAELEVPISGEVIFAIEEPEAFLHPQTQRAMTGVIKSIAADAQVFVTTHSPVVVDSFEISKIVRLPLQLDGTEFQWKPSALADADEGRLSRYCDAANSELVFANAVIFVEGESDKGLVDALLTRVCDTAGGHYARGVTVIDARGLGRIKNLVQLAGRFGVDSFVICDKDGLAGSERRLLPILDARDGKPTAEQKSELVSLSLQPATTYDEALATQQLLNERLAQYRVFVLSSDLEGLLIDTLGVDEVLNRLGPEGEKYLDGQAVSTIEDDVEPRSALGKRIGSKGWQQDVNASGKVPPHLPRILFREYLALNEAPQEIQRIETWLEQVVEHTSPSAM